MVACFVQLLIEWFTCCGHSLLPVSVVQGRDHVGIHVICVTFTSQLFLLPQIHRASLVPHLPPSGLCQRRKQQLPSRNQHILGPAKLWGSYWQHPHNETAHQSKDSSHVSQALPMVTTPGTSRIFLSGCGTGAQHALYSKTTYGPRPL